MLRGAGDGQNLREHLIATAERLISSRGTAALTVREIAREAGVADGVLYNYFDGKEEIFLAVADQVQEEMLHPHLRQRTGVTDPRVLIDLANREYLRSYKKNAKLMALFELVTQIDENFRARRVERGNAFATRNAIMIRELQQHGQADPALDPLLTAHALSGMVSRVAYMAFVLGRPMPFEHLADTLNRIWMNALRLGDGQ